LSTDGLYTEHWDSIALVPYLVDVQGNMVLAHENETSITHKCNYIITKGLRGAMYWDCDDDDESFTLSRTVWNTLIEE
jgi:chitinase